MKRALPIVLSLIFALPLVAGLKESIDYCTAA